MRGGKKWLLVLFLVALAAWLFYVLCFNWLLPKTVSFAVPPKWNIVPLRQPRTTVNNYLGSPTNSSAGMDEWVKKNTRNKAFHLKVYYAADSVAIAYSVHFSFKSWLVNRSYLVDSAAIR